MDRAHITTINRRDLLLLGAATAFPTIALATIPPPPPSLWYLIFIENGVYQISGLYRVTLPASAGTCQNYSATGISNAFSSNFSYTYRTGMSAWQMLLGMPQFRWYEYLDKRNGRYIRIWEYDRLEARFADGSRVKVVFRGPNAPLQFVPLVGTERLPDGTRLYPRTNDRDGGGGTYKPRGSRDGGGVTSVKPTGMTFSWSWSSQETPW